MNNKDTGIFGENLAATYLAEQGFEILFRNWRYKHLEIDLIASKNGCYILLKLKPEAG